MSATIPDPLPPTRRRSSLLMIIAAGMAILLIIAGIIGFFAYHNNQLAQDHIHATATAVQGLSNNHATATTVSMENAAATLIAIPSLTATAASASPYAPFTKVFLYDPLIPFVSSGWAENSICQSSPGGYQVNITRASYDQYCLDSIDLPGEIAYQVMTTVHTGDCGGLLFAYKDVNNLYFFEVCQDGTYNVYSRLKGVWTSFYPFLHPSSVIRQGLNRQNRIAVIVKGDTINMYVNGEHIDTAVNLDLTGNAIHGGHVGVFANDRGHPTSVIYTNALVWTR